MVNTPSECASQVIEAAREGSNASQMDGIIQPSQAAIKIKILIRWKPPQHKHGWCGAFTYQLIR